MPTLADIYEIKRRNASALLQRRTIPSDVL